MKKLIATLSLSLLTPIAAIAGDGTGVCTRLIPDIIANYNVANLELRNGNPTKPQDLVSCVYTATTPDLYGDKHITLTVLLNTVNHRFTVEAY